MFLDINGLFKTTTGYLSNKRRSRNDISEGTAHVCSGIVEQEHAKKAGTLDTPQEMWH